MAHQKKNAYEAFGLESLKQTGEMENNDSSEKDLPYLGRAIAKRKRCRLRKIIEFAWGRPKNVSWNFEANPLEKIQTLVSILEGEIRHFQDSGSTAWP